ncbi:hypothetical protein [Synechococcus sp. PROS-9-1]|uniref:hypothetical protein n=1 Tax=Synechococcus sp. PROS-9-1 TaxID=1968775 RepID=UPI001644C20F|nr:hypothetical protein [Synechococcus sp. PROS-9-1]
MSISTLNSTLLAQRGTQSALLQLGTSVPDQPPNQSSRLTVVDGSLELLDGLETALTGERLLKIEPSQNPIASITEWLQNNEVQELHLIAHGAAGVIQIGTGIASDDLIAKRDELAEWGLDRIVIWSCEVGSNENFIALFEELTGSEVITSKSRLGLGATIDNSGFTLLEEIIFMLPYSLSDDYSVAEDKLSANSLQNYVDLYGAVDASSVMEISGSMDELHSIYEPQSGSVTVSEEVTTTHSYNVPGLISNWYSEDSGRLLKANVNLNDVSNGDAVRIDDRDLFNTVGRWDNVLIKAEGFINLGSARFARLRTKSDDGIDVDINNQHYIRNWDDHAPEYDYGRFMSGDINDLPIKIDWYENRGGAILELSKQTSRRGRIRTDYVDHDEVYHKVESTHTETTYKDVDKSLSGLGDSDETATTTDGTTTAAALNTLDGQTGSATVDAESISGVTGSILDLGTAYTSSDIDNLGDSTETATTTDGTTTAAALNTLDGQTGSATVDAESISGVTGSILDLGTAYTSSDIDNLGDSTETATTTDGTTTAAALNTLDGQTGSATVDAESISGVTGSILDLGTAYTSSDIDNLGDSTETATTTDGTTTAAALNTLDGQTGSATVDAESISGVTGSILDLGTAYTSSDIDNLGDSTETATTTDGTTTAAALNTLDGQTGSATVDAESISGVTGSILDLGTAYTSSDIDNLGDSTETATTTDGTTTAAALNTLDGQTGSATVDAESISGVTGSILDLGTAYTSSDIDNLGDSTETATTTDGTTTAAALNTLDGQTGSATVDAESISGVTGSILDLGTAYTSSDIDNLGDSTETATTTDGTTTAAALNTLDGQTGSATVDAESISGVTGSILDLGTAYTSSDIDNLGDSTETATTTDGTTTAAALNTLDGQTGFATVDAGSVERISGAVNELNIAHESSDISNLGDSDIEVAITSDTTVAASQLNRLDENTLGTVDATSVQSVYGAVDTLNSSFEAVGIEGIDTDAPYKTVDSRTTNSTTTAAELVRLDENTSGTANVDSIDYLSGSTTELNALFNSSDIDNIDLDQLTLTSFGLEDTKDLAENGELGEFANYASNSEGESFDSEVYAFTFRSTDSLVWDQTSQDSNAVSDSRLVGVSATTVDVDDDLTVDYDVNGNSQADATGVSIGASAYSELISIGVEDSDFDAADGVSFDLDFGGVSSASSSSTSAGSDAVAVGFGLGFDGIDGIADTDANLSGSELDLAISNVSGVMADAESIVGDVMAVSSNDIVDATELMVVADASVQAALSADVQTISIATTTAGSSEALGWQDVSVLEDSSVTSGGLGLIDVDAQAMNSVSAESVGVDGVGGIVTADAISHTTGISETDFSFADTESSISADLSDSTSASATSVFGNVVSSLTSSIKGIFGGDSPNTIENAESISAIVNEQGFAEASSVGGTAVSTADQSAEAISSYDITTSEDLLLQGQSNLLSTTSSSVTEA